MRLRITATAAPKIGFEKSPVLAPLAGAEQLTQPGFSSFIPAHINTGGSNAAPNDFFLIMIRQGCGGPSTAAAWLPELGSIDEPWGGTHSLSRL
jgi:hypothetical protein